MEASTLADSVAGLTTVAGGSISVTLQSKYPLYASKKTR